MLRDPSRAPQWRSVRDPPAEAPLGARWARVTFDVRGGGEGRRVSETPWAPGRAGQLIGALRAPRRLFRHTRAKAFLAHCRQRVTGPRGPCRRVPVLGTLCPRLGRAPCNESLWSGETLATKRKAAAYTRTAAGPASAPLTRGRRLQQAPAAPATMRGGPFPRARVFSPAAGCSKGLFVCFFQARGASEVAPAERQGGGAAACHQHRWARVAGGRGMASLRLQRRTALRGRGASPKPGRPR